MTSLQSLRKNCRWSLTVCLTLAAWISPAAALAQSDDIPDESPPLVAPEQFPVFPWDVIKPSKAAYEEARACGFNLAGFVHVEDLDKVRDAGLKCFVSDPSIQVRGTAADGSAGLSDEQIDAAVKNLVAKTAQLPATFGYHIIDEPFAQAGAGQLRAGRKLFQPRLRRRSLTQTSSRSARPILVLPRQIMRATSTSTSTPPNRRRSASIIIR